MAKIRHSRAKSERMAAQRQRSIECAKRTGRMQAKREQMKRERREASRAKAKLLIANIKPWTYAEHWAQTEQNSR